MTKLTHVDKDRIIEDLRQRLITLESKLEAAKAQAKAVPTARESIAATQLTLDMPEGAQPCTKCNGHGKVELSHGGMGDCYRCRGKGYMTTRDKRRYDTYQLHQELDALLEGEERWATPGLIPAELKRGKRIVQHNGWWYISP